jgi:hypothetical protein
MLLLNFQKKIKKKLDFYYFITYFFFFIRKTMPIVAADKKPITSKGS